MSARKIPDHEALKVSGFATQEQFDKAIAKAARTRPGNRSKGHHDMAQKLDDALGQLERGLSQHGESAGLDATAQEQFLEAAREAALAALRHARNHRRSR